MLPDLLIDRAFDLILKLTGAEEALLQNEGIIWLQKKLGLAPEPDDTFDSIYTYTLVAYTLDEAGQKRPKPLLQFFRQSKIREFIRLAYEEGDVSAELQKDVTELLIGPTGQKLNALGIDIVTEMQQFEALFNDVVKQTRTPKDIRQEKDLAQRFERIEHKLLQQQQVLRAAIEQQLKQLTGGEPSALPGHAKGSDFPLVGQVKAWFQALDYGEDNYTQATEDYEEWMITIPARRGFDRILVRCVDGEASPTDVEELYAVTEVQGADEGWLVYNRRISKTALHLLDERKYRYLFSYTLDDLIDQAADFTNYIEWLEKEVKDRGIDTGYVQLACKKDDIDLTTQRKIGTSRYGDTEGGIEGYVDGWLEDNAKEHLSVLGEFGTGKTWFSFHYAWLTLQKYKQTKAQGRKRSRLPLVMPLRDYAKALDVENVIAGFFFSQHNMRISSNVFSQLNRMGKLLLIFDGFDEMAARVDKQAMINNFWELARVVGPGAKAILTCRTEHFPDAKQGRELLSAELMASTKNLTGEPPEFEVLELEKFNQNQIRTMLANRTDKTMVEQVMGNAKLMELAERPVMVDLILDALPKIESLEQIDELNMSRVYLYAVTQRLERDKRDQRTFTSLADKLYFLCEVSWEMLQTDQMSLHFRAFPERLQRLFGDKIREQKELDHWHYDMMGQTMLVRDDEGNYRPAHRSLLEFFAAYKIIASLGVMEEEFLEIARRQSNININTQAKAYTWNDYFKRQYNEHNELKHIAPLLEFRTISFDQLVNLIGNNKLTKAVLDLAHFIVAENTMRKILLPLIQQTSNQTMAKVGYVGSNIAQLMLKQNHRSLEYADLTQVILPEMNFASVSLRGTSLKQAQLPNSLFTKSISHVYSVAFSPDGHLLSLGDVNGVVQIWDTQTYQVMMNINSHGGIVWSISFSPDGNTLATSSHDKTVKLWSVNEQRELTTLTGHDDEVVSVSFSPDGNTLATSSHDKTVKLWSVNEQRELATLTGHDDGVVSVSFSPDGNTLATSSHDKTVKLWSVNEQRELATLTGHKNTVSSAIFSPDGNFLATSSYDKTIKLWSVSDHGELATLTGHNDMVLDAAFSPDGSILTTSSYDKTVKLWSTYEQKEIGRLTGHRDRIWSISFSPDGSLLATGSGDRSIKIWSVNDQSVIATLAGYDVRIWSTAFSPNSQILAIGRTDKAVKLWSTSEQREIKTLSGYKSRIWSIMFSPDGQLLAVADGDTVKLWSTSKQAELATLVGHKHTVHSVAFSPDGNILATGSDDSTVKLWSIYQQTELTTLTNHLNGINTVTFSPDGQLLATGSGDSTVKLWSVNEQRELTTLAGHEGWVNSVVFSPDGELLATCSDDRMVKLWSVNEQRELTTLAGHTDRLWSTAFSPNGELLASGGDDTTVKLWSVKQQMEIATLTGHKASINSLAYSPDGNFLATGSSDNTTRLWNIRTNRCISIIDDSLCAGLDITNAVGITNAQRTALQLLGAVDHNQRG